MARMDETFSLLSACGWRRFLSSMVNTLFGAKTSGVIKTCTRATEGGTARKAVRSKPHPRDPRFVSWARTERDVMDDGFADRLVAALAERISALPPGPRDPQGWRSAWVLAYGMNVDCQWDPHAPSDIRVRMILMEAHHPEQPAALMALAAREVAGKDLIHAINRVMAVCGPQLEAAGLSEKVAGLRDGLSAAFGVPADYDLLHQPPGEDVTSPV